MTGDPNTPEELPSDSGADLAEQVEEAEDKDISEGEHREEFGEDL